MVVPVPRSARLTLGWNVNGVAALTVVHLRNQAPAPFTPEDIENLTGRAAFLWTTHLQPVTTQQTRFVFAEARRLEAATDPVFFRWIGSPGVGSPGLVAGDALPGQCTVRVTWESDAPAGFKRGHTMHPGVAESQAAGQHLLPAAASSLQAGWDGWRGQWNAGGGPPFPLTNAELVTVHGLSAGGPLDVRVVTGVHIADAVRTQRSRAGAPA